jgi:hypothetical protein
MRNHILLLFAAGSLTLLTLAGCGGNDPQPKLKDPSGPSLQPARMGPREPAQMSPQGRKEPQPLKRRKPD